VLSARLLLALGAARAVPRRVVVEVEPAQVVVALRGLTVMDLPVLPVQGLRKVLVVLVTVAQAVLAAQRASGLIAS
jgi:hypothetical protein